MGGTPGDLYRESYHLKLHTARGGRAVMKLFQTIDTCTNIIFGVLAIFYTFSIQKVAFV
jgi:hypothetical protein